METLITRTLSTGETLELSIAPYLNGYQVIAHVNGDQFSYGSLEPLRTPKGDVTHYIAGLTNKVGIYAHEAEILTNAMTEASANNPAHEARRLRDQRERLVRQINGIRSDARADIHGAWDFESNVAEAYNNQQRAEARAAELEAELAEFDAVHPEVLAAINDERSASAERNQWN